MKRSTHTPFVKVIYTHLLKADGFVSFARLCSETGVGVNRTCAALCHLKKHKAADMVESGDVTYWFATPETDDRMREVQEIADEVKPRKSRGKKLQQCATDLQQCSVAGKS